MEQMNSKFSPKAIKNLLKAIPCEQLPGGVVRTCPVRISYPYIEKPSAPMDAGGKPRYSVTLLFPKGADISLLEDACADAAAKQFGPDWETDVDIEMPFRDQHETKKLAKSQGYVAGAIWFRATSIERPQVLDRSGKEITDYSKIKPGHWALVTLRAYYAKGVKPDRVVLGLQNIMMIGEDNVLGGGKSDAHADFEAIKEMDDLDAMFMGAGDGADDDALFAD